MPKIIVVRLRLSSTIIKNKRKNITYPYTFSIVPLKLVLQKFLELPNVFISIVNHIEKCKKSEFIDNIFQGNFWKSVKPKDGYILLPITIYFDDFEINNPLGSRRGKNKLGAIYCSLLELPKEYSSMLENIFLVQLHNYNDHKHVGNKRIFNHTINEIKELVCNGITINIEGEEKKILFVLCYVLGDNLGLNTILGFIQNFKQSYCCRICLATSDDLKTLTTENKKKLRTIKNYTKHSAVKNFGIKEKCIFNVIPNYHVIKNFTLDPMHDILEGICRSDMSKILNNLINKHKFFTLEILNDRLENLNCTTHDTNVTPTFQKNFFKNKDIILTASEMRHFMFNFGVCVGDLVPFNNLSWKLYLLLRKITNIATAETITMELIKYFETITTEYLELYLQVFDCDLKFKHHNLLHYGRAMREYGPMKHMSSIRFEGKHKQIKQNTKVVTSRKNPSYTFALKHQLQVCDRFLNNKGFSNRVYYGSKISKLMFVTDFE